MGEFMGLSPDSWLGNYVEPPDRDSLESVDFSNHTVPSLMSMYLWNACKHGKLFDFGTYEKNALNRFLKDFMSKTILDIPFPTHFTKERVLDMFLQSLNVAFDKSELRDSFESVDSQDLGSVEELARKNKETGEEGFSKSVKILKQDVFPPILWIEFTRFEEVFLDTMQIMLGCLKRWFKLRPRRSSQVRQRSRLTRRMAGPYVSLIDRYFEVMTNFLRLYFFMEVWSCEKESELFTEKLWVFDKVKPQIFEEIFLQFHDSINGLQQSILELKPEAIGIDFSTPTEWAFKQLVQMAEV